MSNKNVLARVCHITTVHNIFDVRIFHRECVTLAKNGYEVYLIGTHDKASCINGVRIIPLLKKRGRLYRFFVNDWVALIKALKVRAKIYHFHDPELIPVGLALKVFGKKVVYDVHENTSLQILSKNWLPFWVRRVVSHVFLIIEKIALRFVDYVIVAGEDIKQQPHFKPFYYKVSLLRNLPIVDINDSIMKAKQFDKIRFVYTGGMSKDRGISEIVEAANRIDSKNFELVLLGAFKSNSFENEVKSFIRNNSKIRYINSLPYKQMFDFISKCHVGLICFKKTPNNIGALSGRNNKIYEYLQSGLAVIGSNFPTWERFIVGNKIGLVVNPDKVNEIANAMLYFINNHERLKTMEKNAKELSHKYVWENEKRVLLNIYKELLK